MLFVLFLCSALCALAGAVMIGLGIPVKEFSFGNTLISSGVIAVVGGLTEEPLTGRRLVPDAMAIEDPAGLGIERLEAGMRRKRVYDHCRTRR